MTENSSTWTKWFPDGKKSFQAKDAEEARKSQQTFLMSLRSLPGSVKAGLSDWASFSLENNTPPPDNQDDFLEQINDFSLDQLSQYVDAAMKGSSQAGSDLQGARRKGIKKYTTTAFQSLCEHFNNFLRAYGGVVEILNAADSQYGNVASATFALLFAVARVKMKAEESLKSCLGRITDALPNLEVYRSVYPDPELGQSLSKAYKEIIFFGREATLYFLGSGFGRFSHAFRDPFRFEDADAAIAVSLVSIRHRCDALLAQRVFFLQKENREILKKLEESEERTMREELRRIRRFLRMENSDEKSRAEELKRYHLVLRDSFSGRRTLTEPSTSKVEQSEQFQLWLKVSASLLVLHGRNHESMAGEQESWLSPVALEFISKWREQGHLVAHHLCKGESTLKGTLSSLLAQLLEQTPAVLKGGKDLDFIKSELSRDTAEGIWQPIGRVVEVRRSPVFLVIDRPERCGKESRGGFISVLLDMVRTIGENLKILVVQRSEFWNIEKCIDEVRTEDGDSHDLLLRMRMDQ